MLQKLNERIQGLVAWIVITLVAITFTLFGVDYYLQSHHDSSVQVDVNGEPISKQAFELSYRRTRQSADPSQKTAAGENQFKQQLLNEMIVNKVSVQAAQTHGFEVSASQADAAIINIPQFQEDGHFSSERYTQVLGGAFFTPESFQKEVRQGMLLNQQRFALIGTSFALPGDINKFVELYLQTRDYEYLTIPASQFVKQTQVSEQDIAAYYQQHRNTFLDPEKVSVSYIRLSMQDIKKSIHLFDSQVMHYYDENKSATSKPYAEVKVAIKEQLLVELAQAKYANKLEQLSDLSYQTPDSLKSVADILKMNIEESELFSRQGTDSPLLKNKQLVKAAFSHDVLELGNNSDPIQIDNDTVVVLRVAKHVPASEKTLSSVKQLISTKLAGIQAEADAMQLGKQLLASMNSAANLNKLVSENKLKWQHVNNVGRDTDNVSASINDLAFSLPRVGEVAGLGLTGGDYVVVSLKTIKDGKLNLLDKEQVNSITQQIEANYGVMDYKLYVNGLMSNAVVVRH